MSGKPATSPSTAKAAPKGNVKKQKKESSEDREMNMEAPEEGERKEPEDVD